MTAASGFSLDGSSRAQHLSRLLRADRAFLCPPPKKPREPLAALQPLPSPAANSCRREAGVLGSTCCRHSCRETLILGRGGGGRILQAMSDSQNQLRAGMGRHRRGWRYKTPGMPSGSQQRSPWQSPLSLFPQGYQAGGYLWPAPNYMERPGLESPRPRVLADLRASSHGIGELGEFLLLPRVSNAGMTAHAAGAGGEPLPPRS